MRRIFFPSIHRWAIFKVANRHLDYSNLPESQPNPCLCGKLRLQLALLQGLRPPRTTIKSDDLSETWGLSRHRGRTDRRRDPESRPTSKSSTSPLASWRPWMARLT
jgi:hypothetical protein